jgi:hypothetical protein
MRLTYSKLTEKDVLIYYSQWFYAAIHVLVSIPEINTIELIVDKLNLKKDLVVKALDFLESRNLVKNDSGNYSIGKSRIHLDKKSPMLPRHHTNWRIEAIKNIENFSSENLHYSSVITVSRSDFKKIREILLKTVSEVEEVFVPSVEEEICSFNLDFFKVGN